VVGRAQVLRHLLALTAYTQRIRLTPDEVNGAPALVLHTDLDGRPRGTVRTGRPVALIKNAVLQVTGRYTPRYPTLLVAGARQG
jgi:hypothetical protein